jgi:hypothetical protein
MASKQPAQSINVDAADLPAVMELVLAQRHSNQGGAMEECLRRYWGLDRLQSPARPAALPVKPLEISTTTPVPKADPAQMHPETAAALQLLRLVLNTHPEDRGAAAAELIELMGRP